MRLRRLTIFFYGRLTQMKFLSYLAIVMTQGKPPARILGIGSFNSLT
ncbi:MAG: hypothetical protein QNJ54_01655 [Prochloraceae cyanobacterium]|nr:hypothetical protein [Prochloraceae cyanobacterium]